MRKAQQPIIVSLRVALLVAAIIGVFFVFQNTDLLSEEPADSCHQLDSGTPYIPIFPGYPY